MEGIEQTSDLGDTPLPLLTTTTSTNDPRDRTVAEWMALDDEAEKTKVVADITGSRSSYNPYFYYTPLTVEKESK